MKILLLGAAGFIGTNLTIELAKKTEDEITLVDRSKAFFKQIVSMDLKNSYNGTMNLFSMFVGWQCGIPIRISESISMAHSADKKTILKNILKPFSKMFATNFMANGEACGRWQFGDKLFDEGKVRVFKTVINGCDVKLINYIREDSLDKNLLHTWCGSNPVKQIAMLPTLMKWKSVFNKFITQHFDLTEHVSSHRPNG